MTFPFAASVIIIVTMSPLRMIAAPQPPIRTQNSKEVATFDVVSVRLETAPRPDGQRIVPAGGPGTDDPGRVRYPYRSLKRLLTHAFDLQDFQLSGPDWLFSEDERFDIQATMRPDTTQAQLRVMLKNLLAERFKLVFHYETRRSDIYRLTVSKTGLKIRQARNNSRVAPADGSPTSVSSPLKFDLNGVPVVSPEKGIMAVAIGRNSSDRLIGEGQTITDLANLLASVIGRPVSDGTGLSGRYDFALTYTRGQGTLPSAAVPERSDDPPLLLVAIREQLGLELKPAKGSMDVLVIDHIERLPTEN